MKEYQKVFLRLGRELGKKHSLVSKNWEHGGVDIEFERGK